MDPSKILTVLRNSRYGRYLRYLPVGNVAEYYVTRLTRDNIFNTSEIMATEQS